MSKAVIYWQSYLHCYHLGSSQYYSEWYLAGASSGIGQGIAVEYAKYGPYLTLTGRSMERLEETKKLCLKSGLEESSVSNPWCEN